MVFVCMCTLRVFTDLQKYSKIENQWAFAKALTDSTCWDLLMYFILVVMQGV